MSRPHKYGAIPRDAAGLTKGQAESLGLTWTKHHDSTKEARRWWELQQLEAAGEISGLERQVPWDLKVNGVLICRYLADFTYTDRAGHFVVEDVKSPATRTPAYILKSKLMFACHGIRIRET